MYAGRRVLLKSAALLTRLFQGSGLFVIWDWRWESEVDSSIWSAVMTVEESVLEGDHSDSEDTSDSDVNNEDYIK